MFISTALVRSLIVELEARGLCTTDLLRHASLDRSSLHDAGRGLRYREFARLLGLAFALSGDSALGLAVGQQAAKTALGVIGMLMVTSRTVRDAYRQLARYGDLLVSGLDWQLEEHGELACVGYTFRDPAVAADAQRFLVDCTLGLAQHFRSAGDVQEIWLQHPEPSYAFAYEKTWGCAVRFQQASNSVLLTRTAIDRVQPHADALLHSLLLTLVDKLTAELDGEGTYSGRVRLALRYETDLAQVDGTSLAQRWGLSRRALQRRLASEGVAMSDLLEEARCHRALDALGRPGSKIKDIAEDLGYSESSAFHRAFKRWTGGRTPNDWRSQRAERPGKRTG